MSLVLIAAVAENDIIGYRGALPWHISEDLQRFKELTVGQSVIMGRKTAQSIYRSLGKALPLRTNIVLSRSNERLPGFMYCTSLEEALDLSDSSQSTRFIIGGQQLYEQTIDRADRLEITHVHQFVVGDAFFPKILPTIWHEQSRLDREGYSFVSYIRRTK